MNILKGENMQDDLLSKAVKKLLIGSLVFGSLAYGDMYVRRLKSIQRHLMGQLQ